MCFNCYNIKLPKIISICNIYNAEKCNIQCTVYYNGMHLNKIMQCSIIYFSLISPWNGISLWLCCAHQFLLLNHLTSFHTALLFHQRTLQFHGFYFLTLSINMRNAQNCKVEMTQAPLTQGLEVVHGNKSFKSKELFIQHILTKCTLFKLIFYSIFFSFRSLLLVLNLMGSSPGRQF